MSVELHEEAGGKVLILNLSGKLAKEDYAHFTPEVERAVKDHGKVRMLVRMHDFHGWTWGPCGRMSSSTCTTFRTSSGWLSSAKSDGRPGWRSSASRSPPPRSVTSTKSKADEAAAWIHEGIVQEVQTT